PGLSVIVNTNRSASTTSRYSPSHWTSRGPMSMVSRNAPPGLTSIATLSSGTGHPGPPNQSANGSGSVHSLHTRSRAASKTRVIEMPRSSVGCSAIRGAILVAAQAPVQPVEAGLPKAAVVVQPVGRFLERGAAQARGAQLRGAAALDEAGVLEHAQVLGHRLHADRERSRELVDGRLAVGEAGGERAPRPMGARGG